MNNYIADADASSVAPQTVMVGIAMIDLKLTERIISDFTSSIITIGGQPANAGFSL